MSTIAVAGGTCGLGRAIADTLREQGKYTTVILSRKHNSVLEKEIGFPIVAIDFTQPENIATVLEKHGVHTLISVINSMEDPAPEISLIKAAELSSVTKRYVPSIWGSYHYGPEQAQRHGLIIPKLTTMEELKKTSLEYSAVYNGYFMDYYGIPNIKTYQWNGSIQIDVAKCEAAIPGQGETPVTFTYTFDIAKFAVAMLELPKWPEESWIIGDRVTWKRFLELAEKARSRKFKVSYDTIEDLTAGIATKLPCQDEIYNSWGEANARRLFADFGLWSERGILNLSPERTLNEEFPHIKALTVEEFLKKAWVE